MIVTVFRSRVRPENAAEYMKMAEKMKELATAMEETHRVWAELPAHRKAQQLGRERFYSEFSIHVCKPLRSHSFKLSGD